MGVGHPQGESVSLFYYQFLVVCHSSLGIVTKRKDKFGPAGRQLIAGSGTFCVTHYGQRLAAHRAFRTKKHKLRPADGQTPGGR